MNDTVKAHHRYRDREKADHDGRPGSGPASIVLELGKDITRTVSWGEDPERNDDGEDANDVKNEDQALDQWKSLGQERVEDDREGGNGDDKHSSVPGLRNVCGVVQDGQALNDCASEERNGHDCGLPPYQTRPAWWVTVRILLVTVSGRISLPVM